MTSRAARPSHFNVAVMRGNQSHASWGLRGGSKIVISQHCPSAIMGRSAANGNHMPAGLTSPSQSLFKGGGDQDKKSEKQKAREESRTERWEEPKRWGSDERSGSGEVENIKCQSLMCGITHVPNMQEGFWQVSLTYIVRKLEKLQAETSLSTFKWATVDSLYCTFGILIKLMQVSRETV